MGFFSFIGKVIGGAAKVAANLATGNPLGAIKAGIGTIGSLASHKATSPTTATKINVLGRFSVPIARGNQTQGMGVTPLMTPVLRRLSPVLPGGSIATPSGPVPSSASAPPLTYAGQGRGTGKRRRASTSRRHTSRKRSSGRRKSRLKFGSPAFRKKYLGHGKKRRSKSRR